jgi:hypothetical protein
MSTKKLCRPPAASSGKAIVRRSDRRGRAELAFAVNAMKFLYTIVVGFVGASMITVVYRFQPNRALARALIALIYLTSALAILAKLG